MGYRNEDVSNAVATALTQAGFAAVQAHAGRDVLKQITPSTAVDGFLIHYALPDPELPYLLGQLRSDANVAHLPLVLAVPADRVESYRRFAEHYRNVLVVPEALPLDAAAFKETIATRFNDPTRRPLTEAERKEQAEVALQWLARLALNEAGNYDIRPAGPAILAALRSDKLSDDAISSALAAIGRLPGSIESQKPQTSLANFVITSPRPVPLRVAATTDLVRHLQQHGVTLSANEVKAIEDLFAAKETDAALKTNLAYLLGSMKPDARLTGERLRKFEPALPAPAAPPAPPKEDVKEPAKEK